MNCRTFYGQTRLAASVCMTSSSSGSGTNHDQTSTNKSVPLREKENKLEAQRTKILSSKKKAKTIISHLLENDITDESDIDCETNSD